ncbi:MAG: pyridoxine 5'-phosphate synthase, partial [Sphingomonadales bacterium]
PIPEMIKAAADTGTDRIELYTEHYARQFSLGKESEAIGAYVTAASLALDCSLGVNAGHDLDRHNLQFFCNAIPWLQEVSIGHALICDALYLGLANTIQLYKRQLPA